MKLRHFIFIVQHGGTYRTAPIILVIFCDPWRLNRKHAAKPGPSYDEKSKLCPDAIKVATQVTRINTCGVGKACCGEACSPLLAVIAADD